MNSYHNQFSFLSKLFLPNLNSINHSYALQHGFTTNELKRSLPCLCQYISALYLHLFLETQLTNRQRRLDYIKYQCLLNSIAKLCHPM